MKNISMRSLLVYFTLFILAFTALGFKPGDFPNHFSEFIIDGDTSLAEHQIERALESVIKRIYIPYKIDGSEHLEKSNYFGQITKLIRTKDPGAKIYLSDEALRNLLGYVYENVHKTKEKAHQEELKREIRVKAPYYTHGSSQRL